MKVGFVGLGKLGRPLSDVSYEKGHDVTGFDPNVTNRNQPREIVHGSLKESMNDREIVFVCVPTPHDEEYGGDKPTSHLEPKDFDYSILIETLTELNTFMTKEQMIVVMSTVLPTTCEKKLIDLVPNTNFVYSPQFIAQGTVAKDFMDAEMYLVGVQEKLSVDQEVFRPKKLIEYYKSIYEGTNIKIQSCNLKEAECIKIFYNTYVTQKINFVNMVQDVADKMKNTDANFICDVLSKSTKRLVSPKYMKPGLGDGGSCHPRDNIALRWLSKQLGLEYDLFGQTMLIREKQAETLAKRVLKDPSGKIVEKKVAFTSTGFKEGVDNEDGSYILLVQHYIKENGGEIVDIEDCDILFQSWPSDKTPENVDVFNVWEDYGNERINDKINP